MKVRQNKFILLDSVIGWGTAKKHIAKSEFQDEGLLRRLLTEKEIVEDIDNSGYVFFDSIIKNEDQLESRLKKIGLTKTEPILALWKQSLKSKNLVDDVRASVTNSDFQDKNLVPQSLQKGVIRNNAEIPDHVFFNSAFNNEDKLRTHPKRIDVRETKPIRSLWHRSPAVLSLQNAPGEGRPIKDNKGTFGGLDYATGLAVDKDGNIYIADTKNHVIKKYDFCKEEFIPLSCLGGEGSLPRQLKYPKGIAISQNNDLYIADSWNHRIQVFSLKGLVLRDIWGAVGYFEETEKNSEDRDLGDSSAGIRHRGDECGSERRFGKPIKDSRERQFNTPTDVAIDSQGYVYVVDKGNNKIQKFSASGEFQQEFGKQGEAAGEFQNPTHIAIDKKDRLYIIDEKKRYVQVFDSEGKYLGGIKGPDEVTEFFRPLAIAIDKKGNVYIGERSSRRIYKFSCEGGIDKGPFYTGHSVGFAGEISYLAIDDNGALYASLIEKGLVVFEPEEYRYEREGQFISGPLDSMTYKCQWHRVLMKAHIPEGTSIEVQTYTSESKKDISEIGQLSPSKDFVEVESHSISNWSSAQVNARDFLVLSPPGRYLWLKVTLKGNMISTPSLLALRIYYPRSSFLQYLPNVYQEDETSRLFLDRFLSIFETIFSGIETKIDNIAKYFDPLSAPKQFLPWLASWLALVLDENWPEDKKRELIRLAPELYKKRGTLAGLKQYIEIYTGLKGNYIIENYKLRRWIFLGQSILGCESVVWGKGILGRLQLNEHSTICSFRLISTKDPVMDPFHQYAHRFSVIIPSSFCDGNKKKRAIRNIVEVEKPAHTQYSLCEVGPRFRVGVQSTIGVDTYIGAYPVMVLRLGSTLGIDSVLGESPGEKKAPTLRIGKKSRIGIDTVIN